jgi:putative nucleotidyltransferase with HDIG domain
MSTGSKKKRRIERVATLELPPGVWGVLRSQLRRGHVLVRLSLCALTAILLWAITRGWSPPMPYHLGDVPARDVTVRTQFQQVDQQATAEAREEARHLAVAVYSQDSTQLLQLQAKLENDVSQIVAAEKLSAVQTLWDEFRLPLAEGTPEPTEEERQQQFQRFREALAGEGALGSFNTAIAEAMSPLQQRGLLDKLPAEHDANQERIAVRPVGSEGFEAEYPISDVLVESAAAQLQKSLEQKMPSLEVASRVFAFLRPQLPVTLKLDLVATRKQQDRDAADVEPRMKDYPPGTVLARAGQPLDKASLELLRLEYQQMLSERTLSARFVRSLAIFGMYIGLFTVCGFHVYQRQPRIVAELSRLATLLALVVLTVTLILVASHDDWRAELVPLLLFGMIVAIACKQELAMLLSAAVTLIGVEATGRSLGDAVVLMATTAVAILLLGRVRSRSKLLSVGLVAAGVAMLSTLGVGILEGTPYWPLLTTAVVWGLWAVIAGSLMTCLLPIVERVFGVQTDLSLIELGDPANPLLQELIRRAPGTYNHSITVASLAEAAAEAIGARGLLVRVGSYFHDIGKMLKPGYFIENQGQGDNRHRSLVPAMSTLVIIAHVKDGADLARQNKIPEPIIDFIQQHHGTTLVEYFYHQASESRKLDPNGGDVDESSFRYPGPKPQTKESGILMMADAVESASRALVEPTPSRIESLVEEISRKRLLDGQFDECGLTLEEVHKIGDSLVKSLTAVYHGRVKYPDQETA